MLFIASRDLFNRIMEKMNEVEQKEQCKDLSNIEVQEVLLDGINRAIIMPQIVTNIRRRNGSFTDPAKDEVSIFKSDSGLSNYHPMGPDTVRPEIAEYFRMMHLDEIVSILESEQRDIANIRSQLLLSYVLGSHLRTTETRISPHNGGWGGIMTNHAIHISGSTLELVELDKLIVKSKFGGDDGFGLYPTQRIGVDTKVYDLSRLYDTYATPYVTLKQLDKCCPNFTEELFKKEFDELPLFLQDAFFDLPLGEEESVQWQPLSIALSLKINQPKYNQESLNFTNGLIEIASTCIGSANQQYSGNAWFINK